ncbi:MAG: hypothetical protein K6F56_00700 [Oscillospiraceae bacterium]|nr:hypothetical protein [Oscillospiraceae bacterium]
MNEILAKAGEIIGVVGIVAAVTVPDYIAGLTKAERMGKVRYSNTPAKRKKKWIWVLIFLAIGVAGLLLSYLGTTM